MPCGSAPYFGVCFGLMYIFALDVGAVVVFLWKKNLRFFLVLFFFDWLCVLRGCFDVVV